MAKVDIFSTIHLGATLASHMYVLTHDAKYP